MNASLPLGNRPFRSSQPRNCRRRGRIGCRLNYRWNLCTRTRWPRLPGFLRRLAVSNFGIEIEKCVQAGLELLLDLILAALKHMHGDVRLAAVFQLQGCVLNFGDFFGGEEAESVNQGEVGHAFIVDITNRGGPDTLLRPRSGSGRTSFFARALARAALGGRWGH